MSNHPPFPFNSLTAFVVLMFTYYALLYKRGLYRAALKSYLFFIYTVYCVLFALSVADSIAISTKRNASLQ